MRKRLRSSRGGFGLMKKKVNKVSYKEQQKNQKLDDFVDENGKEAPSNRKVFI